MTDVREEGRADDAPRAIEASPKQRLENARVNMLADVEKHKMDIEQFLKPFGIEYGFFVGGLRVFLMRQAQTQPDFFTSITPASFMEALFRCSKDGLIPDGKEAAIGHFKGVATYLPMRDGFVKVLWRTGMIKDINDNVVTRPEYETGHFDYEEGSNGYIRHKPSLDRKDTDEAVAAYCVVNLNNGGSLREVVVKADLDKIAGMSRSPARKAWAHQMHRKAAIRRIMGKMPREAGIAQLLAHDEANYDLDALPKPAPANPAELFSDTASVKRDEAEEKSDPSPPLMLALSVLQSATTAEAFKEAWNGNKAQWKAMLDGAEYAYLVGEMRTLGEMWA